MRKATFGVLVLFAILAVMTAGRVMANGAVGGDEPAIMASPPMINLAKVSVVTIHTNIPCGAVDLGTVRLNGLTPASLGVDNRGHLVAKFDIPDLALSPGEAILTLTGLFVDGEAFAAAVVVKVK